LRREERKEKREKRKEKRVGFNTEGAEEERRVRREE
jgi:hypothetical protein